MLVLQKNSCTTSTSLLKGTAMKIGLAIKLARENIKRTEQQLGAKVGLLSSTIVQIENDEIIPSLKDTQSITRALGLRISQLATIAESIHDPSNEIKMLQRRLLLSVQPILAHA